MMKRSIVIFMISLFPLLGIAQSSKDSFYQICYVKYERWSTRKVIDIPGYMFCRGIGIKELSIKSGTLYLTIDSLVTNLQVLHLKEPDPHRASPWPDVRRQLIVVHADHTYDIVSYDTARMEMNGRLVYFSQELFDLIEALIPENER